MSGTERTTRGWRFFAAQAIYWGTFVLLCLAGLICLGLFIKSIIDLIPWQVLAMLGGVVVLGFLVAGGIKLFHWADNYLETHK